MTELQHAPSLATYDHEKSSLHFNTLVKLNQVIYADDANGVTNAGNRRDDDNSNNTLSTTILSLSNNIQNQQSFEKRLSTFQDTDNYFAKPIELSPLVCARFGWSNIGPDLIKCHHHKCKAILSIEFDPSLSIESYKKLTSEYVKLLASHHKDQCPFKPDAERWLIFNQDNDGSYDNSITSEKKMSDELYHFRVPPYFTEYLPELKFIQDDSSTGFITRSYIQKQALLLTHKLQFHPNCSAKNDEEQLSLPFVTPNWAITIPTLLINYARSFYPELLEFILENDDNEEFDHDDDEDEEVDIDYEFRIQQNFLKKVVACLELNDVNNQLSIIDPDPESVLNGQSNDNSPSTGSSNNIMLEATLLAIFGWRYITSIPDNNSTTDIHSDTNSHRNQTMSQSSCHDESIRSELSTSFDVYLKCPLCLVNAKVPKYVLKDEIKSICVEEDIPITHPCKVCDISEEESIDSNEIDVQNDDQGGADNEQNDDNIDDRLENDVVPVDEVEIDCTIVLDQNSVDDDRINIEEGNGCYEDPRLAINMNNDLALHDPTKQKDGNSCVESLEDRQATYEDVIASTEAERILVAEMLLQLESPPENPSSQSRDIKRKRRKKNHGDYEPPAKKRRIIRLITRTRIMTFRVPDVDFDLISSHRHHCPYVSGFNKSSYASPCWHHIMEIILRGARLLDRKQELLVEDKYLAIRKLLRSHAEF